MKNLIAIRGTLYSGKDTVFNAIQLLTAGLSVEDTANAISFSTDLLLNPSGVWENKKFAGKLKDMVCLMLGCTRERLESRDFKEEPLGEQWDKFYGVNPKGERITPLFASYEEAEPVALKTPNLHQIVREPLTPRKMLQLIGTEGGREIIHPNVWVNAMFADFTTSSHWIITDCRFPNEADAVHNHGGIVINLSRPRTYQEWCKTFNKDFDIEHFSKEIKISSQDFGKFAGAEGDIELKNILLHPSETALNDYGNFDYTIDNSGTLVGLIQQVQNILEKENLITIPITS